MLDTVNGCAFCGDPDETICDNCSKPVCFGCLLENDVCLECDLEDQAQTDEDIRGEDELFGERGGLD